MSGKSVSRKEGPSFVGNRESTSREITRRRFVHGVLAGGVIAGLNHWRWPALAANPAGHQPLISGNRFDLTIGEVPVNYTGRSRVATSANGSVPSPTLRWREGDTVTIAVTNRLREPTSIHWHGVRTPSSMDGVPGLSFPGIAPNETFVYQFPVRQHGTFWYHSHSRFQEQTGHYGALIIDPRERDPIEYDREYVVVLADWTDEDPKTIFANLKQQSDYYNFHQRTAGTLLSDIKKNGLGPTISDRLMWGRMNMNPTDILDVSGATYTYLLNGNPPATNWTGIFRPRERVRLRFINASSMTIFDVRIPGLLMTVVQSDGNDVEPVSVEEFRISVAETYDVIVKPPDGSAYTIFAQSMDRTGYARGTLAPREGMSAPIPAMDPRPLRTMADMGMGNVSGMTNMPGVERGNTPGMSLGTPAPASSPSPEMQKHDMKGMDARDMSGMEMGNMPGMNIGNRSPIATATPTTRTGGQPQAAPKPLKVQATSVREGPQVDNVAMMPTERLNEPGPGLNDNGRRVLTYADLRARYRGTDPRPPDREIELHLTGNMERFIWGFDGKKFTEAEPIRLKLGERVKITLINDSMMDHPIHLHGLWSEIENGQGEYRPYKHTVDVKAGERLSFLVSADTPGHWAFHCHLLYHMEAGMFRTVIVS